MGLPWVKLDTTFGTNPKVLYLIEDRKHRAIVAYVCGLGYAGAQGTDGFLPFACLPIIHATKADAKALVGVELWHETIGGWQINGWDEHQQSNEETQLRKQRAQKAAMARWHGEH
jgi:hypothetical protein